MRTILLRTLHRQGEHVARRGDIVHCVVTLNVPHAGIRPALPVEVEHFEGKCVVCRLKQDGDPRIVIPSHLLLSYEEAVRSFWLCDGGSFVSADERRVAYPADVVFDELTTMLIDGRTGRPPLDRGDFVYELRGGRLCAVIHGRPHPVGPTGKVLRALRGIPVAT